MIEKYEKGYLITILEIEKSIAYFLKIRYAKTRMSIRLADRWDYPWGVWNVYADRLGNWSPGAVVFLYNCLFWQRPEGQNVTCWQRKKHSICGNEVLVWK